MFLIQVTETSKERMMPSKKLVVEMDRAEVGKALRDKLSYAQIETLLLGCCERGEVSEEDVSSALCMFASAVVKNGRGGMSANKILSSDGAIKGAEVTFHWSLE
jgi:hypothetical protein